MIVGFVDMHCHVMAHLGFGGRLIPVAPTAPIDDLRRCDGLNHGGGVAAGRVLHQMETLSPGDGHPTGDWPTFNTRIHQKVHLDWLRRAHAGGLRVVCALASTNSLLNYLLTDQPFLASGVEDDHTAAITQIDAMTRLADSVPWMDIAGTPGEARTIAERGNLAVVLGIEVDQLGGWTIDNPPNESQIDAMVDDLVRRRVSYVFPIHLADNVFGGCAVYGDVFNSLNMYLNREFYTVEDGFADGITFRLADNPSRVVRGLWFPYESESIEGRIFHLDLFRPNPAPIEHYSRVPPDHGHQNTKRLTEAGHQLIRALMRRGMMIDIDHMSEKSTNDVLSAAEQHRYPLFSGHAEFREITASPPHESMKSRSSIERLAALNGMLGPVLLAAETKDVASVLPTATNAVPNDCAGSAKSWAQSYLYALEKMGGHNVAFGSDFNAPLHHCGPRFGADAAWSLADGDPQRRAQQQQTQSAAVDYAHYADPVQMAAAESRHHGLTTTIRRGVRPLIGDGLRDINVDGLAHIGMLPDFMQDLANSGLDATHRRPLLTSAEDFVNTWQQCVTRSYSVP